MAKCSCCGREMLTADGCAASKAEIGGRLYERIRVGGRGDYYEKSPAGARCGSCGAKKGFFHHFGCDIEASPDGSGQMISAGARPVLTDGCRIARPGAEK